MPTSSKKTANKPAANLSQIKKSVAKEVVVKTLASKATAKREAASLSNKAIMPNTETTTSKPVPEKCVINNIVSPEDRHHMIATAAYFCAEQRGFPEGFDMEDWILSEKAIDAMLNAINA